MPRKYKEDDRKYHKQHYQDNKEKIHARVNARWETLTDEEKEPRRKYKREYEAERRLSKVSDYIVMRSKARAKSKNLEFNIVSSDIELYDTCPFLGVKFTYNSGRLSDTSMTLDRIDNTKGYIKGNIHLISHKANRIKNNASFEEFELIYLNWKKLREDK